MKKIIAILLSLVLLCGILTACGSSPKSADSNAKTETAYAPEYDSDYAATPEAEAPAEWAEETVEGWNSNAGSGGTDVAASTGTTEKIIYRADAAIETLEFDKALDALNGLIEKSGGYIQASSVSGGSSYETYGYSGSLRRASFTVRIPSDRFQEFTGAFGTIGNVLYVNSSQENITMQYYNVKNRLDAYQAEHDRLLEFMAQAETISDMLEIEQRLSEVEYEIDYYSTNLRSMQRDVDYSTVEITVREVEKVTPQEVHHQTFWEKTWSGLQETLEGVGEFFKNLFQGIIIFLPVLLIIAAIVVLVIVLVRRGKKKKRERLAAQPIPPARPGMTRPTPQAAQPVQAPAPVEQNAPEQKQDEPVQTPTEPEEK